ncbi:MAG: sodium:calcium antiporter [Halobacteriales archaeon]
MLPLVSLPFLPEAVGNSVLLVGSFLLLLGGAEIFTNGIEWLGNRLGVSESATGSILAAVGTALPETMIPVIAILGAVFGFTDESAANEVGVGAILGAPFMLSTIAMFLIAISVLYFRNRRMYGAEFHFNEKSTRRDLGFFLVGYTLAFIAALIRSQLIATLIGLLLVALYIFYVYRSLQSGGLIEDEDLDELHLGRIADSSSSGNSSFAEDPPALLVGLQTLIALLIIIGGAHLFVEEVRWAAGTLGIPDAVLALLLAPLATELPEKFNSVLWISRDKDTLAIGNITGAMAFQGTLPVTLGILFTSWNLSLSPENTAGFLNGLSAILAIVSGGILYFRARSAGEGNMSPVPFLIGGLFYAVFVVVLLYFVFTGQIQHVAGH